MNNILLLEKNCCGCGSCKDVCPQKSIGFAPDEEGFLYPYIDIECVDCGLCLKHCPMTAEAKKPEIQQVYATKHKDDEMLMKSSSGGVFTPLAQEILKKNGVVFGCAFDEKLKAKHIAVENEKDLARLQGSKYVQSDTTGVFAQVKKELEKGRYVLFSGTGCQVAGLKVFLGKDYEKLLTVDIVCHGVPSPKLFESYLCYLSDKENSKITDYSFRSKEAEGWGVYYYKYTAEKTKTGRAEFDPYFNAFLEGNCYRESCYSCKYASENRAGDITLGDYWGIKKQHPNFYSNKGVSVVIVNSKKGESYWNCISEGFNVQKSEYKKAAESNVNLRKPTERTDKRENFYKGIEENITTYFNENLKPPFRLKLRIRQAVPKKFREAIKKAIGKA